MAFKLDTRKFKKIASDGNTTTMQHEDGHVLKIAHAGLSKELQKQISAIPIAKADGGDPVDPNSEAAQWDKERRAKDAEMRQQDEQENANDQEAMQVQMKSAGGKLQKLAPGGDVRVSPKDMQDSSQKSGMDFIKSGLQNAAKELGFSQPSPAASPSPSYSDGGDVQEVGDNAPTTPQDAKGEATQVTDESGSQPSSQAPVVVNVNGGQTQQPQAAPLTAQDIGAHVGNAVRQGIADTIGAVKSVGQPLVNAGEGVIQGLSGQDGKQPLDQNPQPAMARGVSSTIANQGVTPPASPDMLKGAQPQSDSPMDAYTKQMQGGYANEVKGANEKLAAETQLGNRQEETFREQAQNAQNQLQNTQDVQNAAQKERQAFISDIQNQHIDPKHLFSTMGVGSKIGTAIGILLSGLGSGVSGQPNMAMQFLNNMVDKDMEAQRLNLGKSESLLSNNMANFHNLNDAALMTRMQYNDYFSHLLNQSAAQNRTPQAQAARDMAVGQLQQQNAFINSQMGKTPGGNGSNTMDGYLSMMRIANPERAKEIESRYIPNVGIASIPLDQKTRATITERKTLQDNVQQLVQFQQKYGGTLEGIGDPTVRAEGEALAKQVQDQYRRANDQGVFKPAESAFVNGVIGDKPASLFSKYTKLPGYKAAAQINQGNLNQIYKSVGLQPTSGQSQQQFMPKTFKPAQ